MVLNNSAPNVFLEHICLMLKRGKTGEKIHTVKGRLGNVVSVSRGVLLKQRGIKKQN